MPIGINLQENMTVFFRGLIYSDYQKSGLTVEQKDKKVAIGTDYDTVCQ
jgi:hypothetical protein